VLNVIISAAEPSGDVLGAELMKALKTQGEVRARGIAGPHMRAAGVEAIANTEDISVMGLFELLTRLPAIRQARRTLNDALVEGADVFIGIDSPDLHQPLGRVAKALGIPAIGYVSPQLWAWRPNRAPAIAKCWDTLLCLFAFEPPLYGGFQAPGFRAEWVGHPVRTRFAKRDSACVQTHTYALLPGSRAQERRRMLGPFLDVAREVRRRDPNAQFLLVSPTVLGHELPDWVEQVPNVQAVAHARAALSKAGTVSLELAVLGVPMVIAHRVHPLTHVLGRMLVRGIGHIAMPNILAKTAVVPEFVQRLPADLLADALLALPHTQNIPLDALGPAGASSRAASAVREVCAGMEDAQ
jgi:lipid-A-disaccharide synthase